MKGLFFVIFFALMVCVPKTYALELSAECACLIIADTGEVLYSRNAKKQHSIASTTKIMTSLIAIEKDISDEIVTVSHKAQNQEGSSIYLEEGDKVLMKDLIYGTMLNSGNDAACAIAEHISGSVDAFAEEMTLTAKKLGAVNTSFKNANGLDMEGHYSTAYDLAIITANALKNQEFKDIVSTKTTQINVGSDICYLKNHNKLLWGYDGCIGVKTGYTKKTGRCLVSAAERDGITLIAVTLNAPDDWNDHKKMLDYGFENSVKKAVVRKGEIFKEFLGKNYEFNAVANCDIYVSSGINTEPKAEIILHLIKKPTANIYENEKIGYAEILMDGGISENFDIVCDREVVIKNTRSTNAIVEIINIFMSLIGNLI